MSIMIAAQTNLAVFSAPYGKLIIDSDSIGVRGGSVLAVRAYLMLNLIHVKSEDVSQTLRGMPGVAIADYLEGCPDLILMVEASYREELAELVMQILGSLGNTVEDLRLLVTQGAVSPALTAQHKQ